MATCCNCGNTDPDLYYYWDAPLEEDYDWRDHFPLVIDRDWETGCHQ